MEAIKVFLFGSLIAVAGCASSVRGSIVRVPENGLAEVHIANGTVAPGDRVVVSRRVCDSIVFDYADPLRENCRTKTVGRATVSEVVTGRYAMVRLDPGTAVRGGDAIRGPRSTPSAGHGAGPFQPKAD